MVTTPGMTAMDVQYGHGTQMASQHPVLAGKQPEPMQSGAELVRSGEAGFVHRRAKPVNVIVMFGFAFVPKPRTS